MSPFALLLGLFLPAIGAEGAAGLAQPVLLDMTRIERPATPNTCLAGPTGMTLAPDLITVEQTLPAAELYDKVLRVFGARPMVFVAAEFPAQRQVHFVARSALMNYPDLITVQVDPAGPRASTIVIWSRSLYGRKDFGVNQARVEAWLAALRNSNER